MSFSTVVTRPGHFQKNFFFRICLCTCLLVTACGTEPSPSTPARAGLAAYAAAITQVAQPTPTVNPKLPWLVNPLFQLINTPFTSEMSSDGFTWSQAYPIQVDRYNNIFVLAQQNNSGDHKFIFSNDAGKSWAENSLEEKYMTRGSAAYDNRNDKIHVLWNAAMPNDGIIYRRYDIKRNKSNEILSITPDARINLQLDFQTGGTMLYEHPVLLWLGDKESGKDGRLVAVWSAHNDAAPVTNEIRVSQRLLSNSAEDGRANAWRAFMSDSSPPVATGAISPTAVDNLPQVAYSPIFASTKAGIPYSSALVKTSGKHARDVYFFYSNGTTTWEWRRAGWNSQTNDWSNGLTPPDVISKISRSGTDSGYTLKQQLGSKPVEDIRNDRVFFGFATWKDNTQGDTWSHVFVDASDNLSEVADVYSAGKIHSYAPTGDITFDQVSGKLVTLYLKTDKAGIYAQLYDGKLPVGPESLVFNSEEGDIPLLWQGGRYEVNNQAKLLVLFRSITRPYHGYFGTIDLLRPAR
jgi:hypothetical protein